MSKSTTEDTTLDQFESWLMLEDGVDPHHEPWFLDSIVSAKAEERVRELQAAQAKETAP